ncbi:hypothetical protein HOJ01_02430 [bacterium]|jgi:hypothetical protein|nr:hypothetical protein [bacterium]MBT6293641.1 hypothetical protein [bacterium]
MKIKNSIPSLILATSLIQGCVPTFGPRYIPKEVPRNDYLPKPNTANFGLDAICYRTITDSREQIINCINTKSEDSPQEKVQNILQERLSLDLEIQELNPESKVFRIVNSDEDKRFEIQSIIKDAGYHAIIEINTQNIIFY